jgi:putative ABC transport system permease protein
VIAVFILFIAWINYINFAIARSSGNIKEMSIRKISGSSRFQLIVQLITDSALINIVSVCLSLAIVQALLPWLKISLGLPQALSFDTNSLLILVAIFVAGTFASGLYPAISISSLNPVSLLRNRISRSTVSLNLNKALIVFQFTASIVLITGTITVFRQLSFIRNRSIGLNLDQTLIVKGPAIKDSTYNGTLSYFSNETRNVTGLSGFAVSSSVPGDELHWGRSFYVKENPNHSIGASIVAIDENFFALFDAEFIAGSNFDDGGTSFRDAIIINETMARELGITPGKATSDQIIMWNEGEEQLPRRVIGIVRDFNQQSFKKKIEPIVFTLREYVYAPWAGEYYSFKISGNDLQATIANIEQLWKKVYPQNPFDYFFLDEHFDTQYRNDRQFGKVFTMFAAFAILIASLGLFGLTAYMISMRTKEIGVRKVLGSSSFQLVHLLSSSYLMLVIIAFVFAIPIAYWLMSMWLSQFEYRINISALTFLLAGAISFLTAMITVGYKSWSAANMNPADALKYE